LIGAKMDALGRLLLRFLLVPLGYVVAVVAGSLAMLLGSWKLGQAAVEAHDGYAVFGFVFAAPILLLTISVMWLPGAIGILISETFAVRSWIFHAGNGAVSAWIGWDRLGTVDASGTAPDEPLVVVAAGLAWGLAYWAIAGSSAGFWKPVLRRPEATASPPPQIR
jgi:hypothetical protein